MMEFTGERYIPGKSPVDVEYEHWHRYFYAQQFIKDKDVLDIACGTGYGSALMAETAAAVTGIDIDKDTITFAESTYIRDNLRFKTGSLDRIPLEGNACFDVIVSFETIEHVEEAEQSAFLTEVKRLLKPGGILIISTPDSVTYNSRAENYKNEFHKHEFTRTGFIGFLGNRFANVGCVSQCPIWGSYIHIPGKQSGQLSAYGFEYSENGIHQIPDAADNTYIIAVCSDSPLPHLPFSVSIDKSRLYYKDLLRDQAYHRDQWTAEKSGLENSCMDLKTRNAALEEAVSQNEKTYAGKITELAKKLSDAYAAVESVRSELAASTANTAEIKKNLATTQDENARLASENRKILDDNDFLLNSRTSLETLHAETLKRIEILEKLLSTRDAEILQLKDEVATCTEEKTRLQNRINILASDREEIILKIKGNQDSISELARNVIRVQEFSKDQIQAIYDRIYNVEISQNAGKSIHSDILNEIRKCNETLRGKIAETENKYTESAAELARTKNGISFRIGRALTLFPRTVVSAKIPSAVKIPFILAAHPVKVLESVSFRNIARLFHHLSGKSPFDASSVLSNYLTGAGLHPSERPCFTPIMPDKFASGRIMLPTGGKNPSVSIIIPVFNQWAFTASCLASLADTIGDVKAEVILADDFSSDQTKTAARKIKGLKYLRNKENLGFLRTCNNAAKSASGKYILFLNNDTNPQRGWLSALVETLEENPDAGIAGSKLVYSDGTLQEAGGIIWNDASGWNYGRGDDPDKPEFNYLKDCDYVSGASLMIRAELWNEIGGFDDRYAPAYFEDADLCFECRKHGKKVLYQPASVVVHHEGKTCGAENDGGVKNRFLENNRAKFRTKWADVLDKENFSNPGRLDAPEVFTARDRSRSRKCLLVVDHHVPFYDQNAGDRASLHYLKLFSEMGFNVKFIGDNYYRHEPYTEKLQQIGIEVLYGPEHAKDKCEGWIKTNARYINAAFVQRPHIVLPYIDILKKHTSAKIIYFGHDLHGLRIRRQYELEKRPELLEAKKKWDALESEIFEKADVVTFLSVIETAFVRKHFPHVHTSAIPFYVHDYFGSKSPEYHAEKRNGILCVGGFGHTPNVDAAMWLIKEIMPFVWRKSPGAKVHLIGSETPECVKALESDRVVIHGRLSDDELISVYKECRLSVVPLRYGAGIKGKVVEAFERGIPAVCTSIGLEGFTGLPMEIVPYDTARSFAAQIQKLLTNGNTAESLSAAQYKYISEFLSKKSAIKVFSALFNG